MEFKSYNEVIKITMNKEGGKIDKNFIKDKEKKQMLFFNDYFERVFIKSSIKNNKPLSGTALRLAALLIMRLDEYVAIELPSRNELASILGVSRTAIINGLAQLEEEQFLIRKLDFEDIVLADEDDDNQKLREQQCKEKKLELMRRKDFSGKFRLNFLYNEDKQEINISELLEKVSKQSVDMVKQAFDSYQIEGRLLDIEFRLKRLENEMSKNNKNYD